MKITDLKTTVISVPFRHPMVWRYGQIRGGTLILCEVETDAGIVGIGESIALAPPGSAAQGMIDACKPLILGEDPFDIERISKKFYGYGGWHFSRFFGSLLFSGVDMACWDIMGKYSQLPLFKLLGGRVRAENKIFNFIHQGTPEEMAAEAVTGKEEGRELTYLKYETKPGIGVELDPDKVRQYHEHYRTHGTFGWAGIDPALSTSAPTPVVPAF